MTANPFDQMLAQHQHQPLLAASLDTLQVNLGKLCNQACKHCHVDAGPQQTAPELNMSAEMVAHVLRVLRQAQVGTLDLTGGAPELNANFRPLVSAARQLGVKVMDRCNLSVLFEPGQADLAGFLAAQQVEVVASLPYFRRDRTDRQRGTGVFDASIEGLQLLNSLGYGKDPKLQLNLVYNPVGAYLPGNQAALQAEFKHELDSRFDISFDQLFCITNMPIARFSQWLERSGNLQSYMQSLLEAFNPGALDGLMCRSMISVAPDGSLHDCDFNQMLGMPLHAKVPQNIRDFDLQALRQRQIQTAEHCLGCTAGAGSSCGGAVTAGAAAEKDTQSSLRALTGS